MSDRDPGQYVLVTAAYNEENYIGAAIDGVISQPRQPLRWIIVSDNSTDGTDEIVERYSREHAFIRLHRNTEPHRRNYAAQVEAINTGIALLQDLDYDFIGNLDADIVLTSSYCSLLLNRFAEDPTLGLAGGFLTEATKGELRLRRGNTVTSVPHGVQMFRRECLYAIGGAYAALPYGGPDTYAENLARFNGWKVQAFPEITAFHQRPTGSADGRLRYCARQGMMDYSLGYKLLFELGRIVRRIPEAPYGAGAFARLCGFLYGSVFVRRRPVPKEFVRYFQREQVERMWSAWVRRTTLAQTVPRRGRSHNRV